MKRYMSKNMKIWLMLATLIVGALLAAFWAITFSPFPSLERLWEARRYPPPPGGMDYLRREDIELYYAIKTVISTINAILLIFLLITYISIYIDTRSEFTIGLIIFSMVLLLYALVSNPLMHWAFGFQAIGLGPFAMLPDLFTCLALVVLLYLSIKY